LLSNPLHAIRITHISLALVGLMWVLPFLHYRHEYPLTTFDQESWSAVLGLFAMTAMLAGEYWRQPQVPRIALLPVALIGIVFAQLALGKIAYFEQGLLYILYLLFALLLMLLGSWLRRSLGIEKLACVLAIFLLVGAELSALIGVLQHFGWHTWLNEVIVRKISPSLYGNLAQPNHYANYIALGLVSLGLLYQQQKLKVGYVALLAMPLLFALTLSGSRSSWLYMLVMAGLSLWAWRRERALRPLLGYSLALILGFVLMHLAVQLPFLAGSNGDTDTLRRFANSDTNGSIRLYLWHEAALIFMQSPWVGVGFGQFAWHHFELLPELRPNNIAGLYNNAHDVIFQLAAETGLAGLFAFFATAGAWLYGLRLRGAASRQTGLAENGRADAGISAAYWWGYTAVGVLFTHSLLEYPLWYAYFIAIFAFLLGMLDETHYRLEMRRVGRLSLLLILLLGLVTMLQVQIGYRELKSTLAIQPVSGNTAVAAQRTIDGLEGLRGSLLLVPYVNLYSSRFIELGPQHSKEKIAFNDGVMHFIPTPEVVYQQAFLLAQDGQLEAAKKLFEQAIWSYPNNGNAHRLLLVLVEKDPAHFSALLEFATQKEQEHARAVRNK
jgi:O-antigen ligase